MISPPRLPLAAALQEAAASSFTADLAAFVDGNPVVAAVAAALLVLLVMLLVRKLLGVAMVAVVIVTVLVGVLVAAVGPDQARAYLEQAREVAPALIQGAGSGSQ